MWLCRRATCSRFTRSRPCVLTINTTTRSNRRAHHCGQTNHGHPNYSIDFFRRGAVAAVDRVTSFILFSSSLLQLCAAAYGVLIFSFFFVLELCVIIAGAVVATCALTKRIEIVFRRIWKLDNNRIYIGKKGSYTDVNNDLFQRYKKSQKRFHIQMSKREVKHTQLLLAEWNCTWYSWQ